jgi:RNA polymerase sigma factor (sigma-70 family)
LGLAHKSTDEIMRLVRDGDALAFEQLFYQMSPVLRRFLAARGWRASPMDDILQESFCRIWEKRRDFVVQPGEKAKSYVLTIALNVARENRRCTPATSQLGNDDAAIIARREVDECPSGDLVCILRRARSLLSEKQSTAITLIYDRQMVPQEAAKLMGCTEKALRRRIENGRRKLHKLLLRGVERLPGRRRSRVDNIAERP